VSYTFACLGKGGTGKTLVSLLLARLAHEQGLRALLIDADPVGGLTLACGIEDAVSIAEAREAFVEEVRALPKDASAEETRALAEWMVSRTLVERPGFSLFSIGQRSSLRCYCSLNALMRQMIGVVVQRFELVVVDAEAGIEQVNREAVERIDHALLLCDGSQRAVQTCLLLRDNIDRVPMMRGCKSSVLFNRVHAIDDSQRQALNAAGLELLGLLPADEAVSRADKSSDSFSSLSANALVLQRLRSMMGGIGPFSRQ
jgi:CO dehydrogenase maturation factor